ncbi:hypothetical protein MFLAVUS_009449 [Mucor flavus]|uniref:Uncharacterized protein n=1 Tax=Mucor flavus TaxID=439312 RepID=A0ABP9Z9Y2_9FUNG
MTTKCAKDENKDEDIVSSSIHLRISEETPVYNDIEITMDAPIKATKPSHMPAYFLRLVM